MAFRMVYTEFWNDPKVMEDMTPEDKYFYLYLLTNPCTNMIGIYRIVKKQMAFDLGYSIESINSLMGRFINNHKLVIYNEETKEICIKNYGKYNLNKGGKPMIDCIKKDLGNVIDKTLIKEIATNVKNTSIKQLIEEYLAALINVSSNDTCTNQEEIISDTYDESERNYNLEGMAQIGRFDDTLPISGQNHKPITNNHNPKSNNQYPNPTTNNNDSFVVGGEEEMINIYTHFQKCGFIGSAKLKEFIDADIKVFGANWMMEAASECVKRGKINNYGYLLGILQNWQTKGREQSKARTKDDNVVKPLRFNNFEARQYDYDSLEKKLLGWDK
ncbi:hypothetical protein [Clostridium chromiireducens]|uniref:DnaD domain protein n=1 Tax=Clostridium chromiireducens TaxID=225345 RepID=A0A1V4IUY3_9CLOT|nr:hypothetical protein [Clostridium chromiireducens]OPJ63713.1 hypothetical protein CLCHR_15280 [Clostridium chromiireducens]